MEEIPRRIAMKTLLRMIAATTFIVAAAFGSAQTPAAFSAAQQFRSALVLAQRGDAFRALAVLHGLLERIPDYVPALKLQGMLLEGTGHWQESAVAYEKGLKLAPNDADLLYKVGVIRLVEGKREEAIALLQRHLRVDPRDGDALYYLAQAQHLTGYDDLALAAIRSCLKWKPNDAAVQQKYGELLVSSGNSESGFEWLNKAQAANPQLPRIDFDLGIASFGRMDFAAASQFLGRAIAVDPDDLEALRLHAEVKTKLAQWADAKMDYERILVQNIADNDALMGLGRSQLEIGEYQRAVETLTRLLNVDPATIQAHYYLSKAYAALGNQAEAQHQADLHHRMVEQTSFATSVLGNEQDRAAWAHARELLANGREQEALQLFQGAEKGASPSAGRPRFLLGALYLYLGDSQNGLANLRRALELDPKIRGAHTYLGIYDLQQGDLDQAEREFQTEIANDPNYETAVAELGVIRYKQRRWDEAASQLEKSHTKSPALLLMLCDAYFHLNCIKDADLTAEIAAAYGKNDQGFMDALIQLLNNNGQSDLAQRLQSGTKR